MNSFTGNGGVGGSVENCFFLKFFCAFIISGLYLFSFSSLKTFSLTVISVVFYNQVSCALLTILYAKR